MSNKTLRLFQAYAVCMIMIAIGGQIITSIDARQPVEPPRTETHLGPAF